MLTLTLATLTLSLLPVLGIQLPKPKGPFEIGTTSFELTDHSRLDPFAPTPENRSVQLSVHYPILSGNKLPFSTYLPFLTAKAVEVDIGTSPGTLQNISTHAHLNASILNGGNKSPVVLFSPGLPSTRLVYATFVQDLASEGYIVVSIDHPRDASIVELSDGRVITGNVSDTQVEAIDLALEVRVADARFILDEIAAGRNFIVPGLHKGGLDTSRVGYFGHSFGGAAAATTMVLDRRVVCGVNMDGSFFGPDVQRGFSKPFMIMARKGHNLMTEPSWAEVFPKFRGFKQLLEIKGALHETFTDGPVLGDLIGFKAEDRFGTIAGGRFEAIQHAYLTAFFDFALKGKKQKLLEGPNKEFPEVSFFPQV